VATYKYRAKKGSGETVEGGVEAQSEEEAVEKVNQMGYLPIFIRKERERAAQTAFAPVKPSIRIKPREITIFSRQLASLLKSGVPILKAVNIISEQSEDIRLRNMLKGIHDSVREGAIFSSALEKFPNVFPPLYIALIHAGEDSGALPEVLLRLNGYRIKQEEASSRFRMALAYPVLMALVGLATVVFMLTFVMPRLMRVFISMGQDLPLPTKLLLSISQGLQQWWFWIILVIGIAVLILRWESNTPAGRMFLSSLKLRLPVLGKFILRAELARFSRTLELLIKDGIPILKAIDIAMPVLGNEAIKDQLIQSHKDLKQGGSFGRSLKNSKLVPLFMSNIIIVGEESGKLDEALAEAANLYEQETEEVLKVMMSLLEPLMILVMGLIVGFIVIAMLLPIFEINMMAK
jgi:type II secretory pathway component PulF